MPFCKYVGLIMSWSSALGREWSDQGTPSGLLKNVLLLMRIILENYKNYMVLWAVLRDVAACIHGVTDDISGTY